MKNKFKSLLSVILFSWIIIFGTAFAGTECLDLGYCSLDQVRSFGSRTDGFGSTCENCSQYSIISPFAATDKRFCCEDKICKSKEDLLRRVQYSHFQPYPVGFVYT